MTCNIDPDLDKRVLVLAVFYTRTYDKVVTIYTQIPLLFLAKLHVTVQIKTFFLYIKDYVSLIKKKHLYPTISGFFNIKFPKRSQ